MSLAIARLPIYMPACAATLARECWVDLLDTARGLFLQTADQQPPARGKDLPVQPSLLAHVLLRVRSGSPGTPGHVSDAQILDSDQVEPARQVSADLLAPVFTGIGLPSLKPGEGKSGPGTTIASALCASHPALQQAQAPLARWAQPGTAQQFTSGQRCACRHAAVYANHLTEARGWNGLGNRSERHMPAARPVQRDPERPHPIGDGPGPSEPDPTALGDEYFPCSPAQLAHMFRFDPDNAKPFVASGLAPCRFAVSAGEEVPHGLHKVAERLLLHHLTANPQPGMFSPRGRELPALLRVTRRTRPAGAVPRLLFTGEVPDKPGMGAMLPQHRFLGNRWKQAVTRHTKTLSSTTDIPEEVKRRVIPFLKTGVTTPRTG